MRRRNATTEFLKECMADALVKLLQKKPLESITISEITDTADVGRSTFYRNFSTKEDLLRFKADLVFGKLKELPEVSGVDGIAELAEIFFQLMYDNRNFLDTVVNAGLGFIVLESWAALPSSNASGKAKQIEQTFVIYGVYGVLLEWMKGGYKETPHEMADFVAYHMFREE